MTGRLRPTGVVDWWKSGVTVASAVVAVGSPRGCKGELRGCTLGALLRRCKPISATCYSKCGPVPTRITHICRPTITFAGHLLKKVGANSCKVVEGRRSHYIRFAEGRIPTSKKFISIPFKARPGDGASSVCILKSSRI